jgi:hypothetical protein
MWLGAAWCGSVQCGGVRCRVMGCVSHGWWSPSLYHHEESWYSFLLEAKSVPETMAAGIFRSIGNSQ